MQVEAQDGAVEDAVDGAGENAQQLLRALDNISYGQILVIILVAVALIWAVKRFFPWLSRFVPTRYRLVVLGTAPVLRLIIIVIAAALIIPEVLILNRENVIVIAGASAVAIGFAFKDLVSSLIAGIVAIFEKPYRPGDWVRVGKDYGEVRDLGLRSFTIVTPSDDVVTVAHDRLWRENIINGNDGADTLMCVADFFLEPDHDAELVRARLKQVALTSPFLSYRRRTLVELVQKPYATHYKVKAYPFDMRDQFRFVSDITVRGKEQIRKLGAVEAHGLVSLDAPD